MPRFFVSALERELSITGEDAAHIARSLRMKPGDRLTVCDGSGNEAAAVIRAVAAGEVLVEAGEPVKTKGEPAFPITLYQACPKGDKFDFIVQKAVELGASRIVLTLTERCVSRPKSQDVAKKLARYRKIALEAAKQCGRGVAPAVDGLYGFEKAVDEMARCELPIFFYECAARPLRSLLPQETGELSLMIGSEGGFSEAEAAYAKEKNLLVASLGPRILRCETAPVAALSALLYQFHGLE